MVEIQITYQGELRCQAVHGPSGTRLATDAPKDNMGRGESFSPTDLVATALATCVLTTMGIVAQRHGQDLGGATAKVQKEMATAGIRRIARLPVEVHVPAEAAAKLSDEDKRRLEHAAHACPVHKSLHPEIDSPLVFRWGGEENAKG